MQGVSLKDNDFVEHLFIASTHSYMLFSPTRGKVYRLKVCEIPGSEPPSSRYGDREPAAAREGRDHFTGDYRDERLPSRMNTSCSVPNKAW